MRNQGRCLFSDMSFHQEIALIRCRAREGEISYDIALYLLRGYVIQGVGGNRIAVVGLPGGEAEVNGFCPTASNKKPT